MTTLYHYELVTSPELTITQKSRLLEFALALVKEGDPEQAGTFILSEHTSVIDTESEETTFRVEAKEAMAGTLRDACEKLSGQMQEFLDRDYYD